MMWKFVPLILGVLIAYAVRGRPIHDALSRKKPFRATLVLLRTAILTVPGIYLAAAAVLIVRDGLLRG